MLEHNLYQHQHEQAKVWWYSAFDAKNILLGIIKQGDLWGCEHLLHEEY